MIHVVMFLLELISRIDFSMNVLRSFKSIKFQSEMCELLSMMNRNTTKTRLNLSTMISSLEIWLRLIYYPFVLEMLQGQENRALSFSSIIKNDTH